MKKITIAFTLLALLLLYSIQAFSQSNQSITPQFNNQGEQEDYWIKQLFQKEYKEQKYALFAGKIAMTQNTFYFDGDALTIYGTDTMKAIFSRGLLYPALIGGHQITDIEEVKFAEDNPQKKEVQIFIVYQAFIKSNGMCF